MHVRCMNSGVAPIRCRRWGVGSGGVLAVIEALECFLDASLQHYDSAHGYVSPPTSSTMQAGK